MAAKKILVTGGAGYVGSHALIEMLNSGYECVVVDNLVNAHTGKLSKIQITNIFVYQIVFTKV